MTDQPPDAKFFYLTSPRPCPYLPDREERMVFARLTGATSPAMLDELMRKGFRRSQDVVYFPNCDACSACVPVRVLASEFRPGRGFRRTLARNGDLVARRLRMLGTSEHYALFRDYVTARHDDGDMAGMSYGEFRDMVSGGRLDTTMTEYRRRLPGGLDSEFERWPLVAACLTDRLSDGLSMLYCYYDPVQTARSLGTYAILDQVAQARQLGLPYLYLGYWIEGSAKMGYKSRFVPQERLVRGGWLRAPR